MQKTFERKIAVKCTENGTAAYYKEFSLSERAYRFLHTCLEIDFRDQYRSQDNTIFTTDYDVYRYAIQILKHSVATEEARLLNEYTKAKWCNAPLPGSRYAGEYHPDRGWAFVHNFFESHENGNPKSKGSFSSASGTKKENGNIIMTMDNLQKKENMTAKEK